MVLDASVWVSRQIRGNANQAPATARVNGHLQASGYFVKPAWLLADVATAIARQIGSQDALLAKVAAVWRSRAIWYNCGERPARRVEPAGT